ncbi:hypothetical protein [Actinoplanes sp. NPDC020271]|uniref:hypothetical protein n=1 Tax=Actinoplanes sp. NPDC020271 TaxID=3363896 RepID=UPI00378AD4C8
MGDGRAQLGAADGFYVGPANVDVATAVSGPELTFQDNVANGSSVGTSQRVASGVGRTDDTGKCQVLVDRITGDTTAQYLRSQGDLTEAEEAGLADGTMVGVETSVLCDAQGDG